MAARTRTATPAIGTIALILVGGAIATAAGAVTTFAALLETDVLAEFRHSTAYYALQCLMIGVLTAIGITLTRPRGPLAPIVAAICGYIALYVGIRTGLLVFEFSRGAVPTDHIVHVLKPHFETWDLLAPLAAAAVGGLRVLMVAGSLAPRRPPGQPFAQPHAQPGDFAQPPYPPMAGQPMPMQAPAPSYQPPPVPGPGQGAAPGWPQGGAPPNVGG